MGDLIRAGVTGAAGHVDEPFLDATIRPEILFPAYASGRNLAEAYYAAMPFLSWQTIIVGDPLCAPFPHAQLATLAIDAGLDAATELPAYFAKRRLSTFGAAVNKDAAALFARAESRTDRNDTAGVRQALEAAVTAEPRFTTARLQLGSAAESDGDYDRAIAQFRAILGYAPNDPIALNNLAYDLAVYLNKAEEALPIAQRAIAVAKTPKIYDTLAWIQHLLKQDSQAAASIRIARSTNSLDPEILWHSAVIYAAINDLPRAAAELSLALKIKPDLADRDDVKVLRQRLPNAGK
jgi:tetratricopeptide (TPR) repeat protein